MTWKDEAEKITNVLKQHCGLSWDGKEAVAELRAANYHWRQMEWLGWYFEYSAQQCVLQHLKGAMGPAFGRTVFDCKVERVWDFKAHPSNGGNKWMILNDKEAIEKCITKCGGVGFIVAVGEAEYDTNGTFKAWHDKLKGGVSEFERERVVRGALSRRRKIRFKVNRFVAFYWDSLAVIGMGRREGWIGEFQEGMRNANGQLRRAKYKVRLTNVEPKATIYV